MQQVCCKILKLFLISIFNQYKKLHVFYLSIKQQYILNQLPEYLRINVQQFLSISYFQFTNPHKIKLKFTDFVQQNEIPKSWKKHYEWISEQKTILEQNYEKQIKKVDEDTKQQEIKLKEIKEKVEQSRTDLSNQSGEIYKKYQNIQAAKESIQKEIDGSIKQYNKYAKKVNKSKSKMKTARSHLEDVNCKNQTLAREHFENVAKELSNLKSEVESKGEELEAKLNNNQPQSKPNSIEDEIDKCNSQLSDQNRIIKSKIAEQIEKCYKKLRKASNKTNINAIKQCIAYMEEAKSKLKSIKNKS